MQRFQCRPALRHVDQLCPMTTSPAMFYGSSSAMSSPSKNKLKRQSRIFSQVLYRTLSYKDRSSVSAFPLASSDDPAELSTQVSAPGVLKIFGGNICAGTNYKSVLATGSSSARELVKEALERYGLSKVDASHYVLCDVIGMFSGSEKQWQTEGLRVLGDNEKPLLIQDLWKPKEGFSRRLELRKRSEVEELAARDVDTITAGINAQARKLQRNRAKGTMTLLTGCKRHSTPPTLRRSVSETSLSHVGSLEEEQLKRHYSTLPETIRGLESSRDEQQAPTAERNGSSVRYSLYQSPHLLLLQGYSYQHEKTKELAEKQSQHQDPGSLSRFTITDLVPDLQHILFWMSNSIELLYFIQQKSPIYIQSLEEELDVKGIPLLICSTGPSCSSSIVSQHIRNPQGKPAAGQDPGSLSRFTITDLVPDLQHILFWMSNSIELLYFIQQKSPIYIQSLEEELDVKGSKESLFSSTITASEEAMTVLEEVIMYTFQQCVYYISKSLYVSLPALLECNPFQSEGQEGWRASSQLPEEIRRVVLIYQATLDLLHQYEVHPEIASQMFAYLFFFSNTLLFNQLMDKGCFHWSKGVKIRAGLRLLLEWMRGMGFGHLAEQFFSKLSSVAHLLAMPSTQLAQMTWPLLRAEFPALSPAQLHHILTQSQAASEVGCVTAWQEDSPAAFKTDEVLESFDNHPPIVLPSGGFKVDLEVETLDDNVYRHLLYIRHFLWSLRSKSPHAGDLLELEPVKKDVPTSQNDPEVPENTLTLPALGNSFGQSDYRRPGSCVEAEAAGSPPLPTDMSRSPRDYYTSEPQHQEKLKHLQLPSSLGKNHLSKASVLPVDPSCLLTPPNTPLNFDPGCPESPQSTSCGKVIQDPRKDGLNGTKATTPEGCSPMPYDYPTPASSSRSSATDDFCYVFVVELEKGPIGLGMGLIDGLHTPLNSPGIYIRTLIQGSPAASDGRLSIGDRILAVNGTSLIGADYQSAVELIRAGGKKLRFLVAKSDMEIAKKISSSSPSSS
ncbi:Ras-associating and dilute domain-containing protein [Chelonia mydas]|uniref:Ras-associating and dilute domain-containing protein n=1 Tax=Chelonia mydas TaxID=8469 RepID=M7BM06_CHEMY|nr:Ras-associating and dilute domain-containing protein [Chelonia mydas]